ncbi:MAG: ABC transporter substrate binding protein [Woeseiaceae bacterium]
MAALVFSGCSLIQPDPAPTPMPEPVEPVEPEAEVVVVPTLPAPAKKTPSTLPAPPPLPPLAIVLTSGVSAYADVAEELTQRFENHTIYNLAEDARPPVSILRLINDTDSSVVVAIGLRAAVSSIALANKPVVFSQVFNHQDLPTDNSRGVSAIAPLDAQIAAWKALDPSISRVGAIVGTGHETLIAEAEVAAERHGLELLAHVADSDQETLFAFKRMIRNIDAFWLFPDNRILSPRALQEIIASTKERRIPMLVPTESMLAMGADVSISTVASDIADVITDIIRQIQVGNFERVPVISPLREIRVVSYDPTRVADR